MELAKLEAALDDQNKAEIKLIVDHKQWPLDNLLLGAKDFHEYLTPLDLEVLMETEHENWPVYLKVRSSEGQRIKVTKKKCQRWKQIYSRTILPIVTLDRMCMNDREEASVLKSSEFSKQFAYRWAKIMFVCESLNEIEILECAECKKEAMQLLSYNEAIEYDKSQVCLSDRMRGQNIFRRQKLENLIGNAKIGPGEYSPRTIEDIRSLYTDDNMIQRTQSCSYTNELVRHIPESLRQNLYEKGKRRLFKTNRDKVSSARVLFEPLMNKLASRIYQINGYLRAHTVEEDFESPAYSKVLRPFRPKGDTTKLSLQADLFQKGLLIYLCLDLWQDISR